VSAVTASSVEIMAY